MNSFWAMYSLRMSFCNVPPAFVRSAPCFSATAINMAHMMAAGLLMVMDVVTSSRLIPSNRISMSAMVEIATPQVPNSPAALGSSVS